MHSTDRPAAPARPASARDEHHAIKKIGRLVVLCAAVLVVSALLLITTALQVMRSIDSADLAAERQRAANAVDAMTQRLGPITPESAVLLGRLAGLRDLHLADSPTTDPGQQHIPLLAGQGPSGSHLVWARTSLAEDLFRRFAPIRLPIIGGMMMLVLGMLVAMLRLVGDIERQRRLAHQQSRSDPLTGLANRLALETALAGLAGGSVPFAVVVFDLDRFKDINDAFGHPAGDEVLREIARRLSQLVGPDDLLARVGGDEFVLLSTSRTSEAALSLLAQGCVTAAGRPISLDGRLVTIGVSLGIVPAVATRHPPLELMAMADSALYRAKSQGGSAFCLAGEPVTPEKSTVLLSA